MAEAKVEARAKPGAFKLPHLRWWIIGLVFLATLINYLDRLTVSVLAPVITRELRLSNFEYASLGTAFLLAYTISQGLSGRLYDRIGTRRGFAFSITLWSAAAMAHAFARGLGSLSIFRFLLGLGEAGNWPGAAKAIAEWFPVRERAFAMAIFNSGAAIGSIIAPPAIIWMQFRYGWQATFLITGALGFCWLAIWLIFYQTPDRHRWLTREEAALIRAGQPTGQIATAAPRWAELLKYRQVWGIIVARLLVDPVWWLYLTWLPLYLSQARGFSLRDIGYFAWVPYLAADAGSLTGGWLSGHLIARGWRVESARRAVIAGAALLMPAGILAARALIGVVLFGFQVWINNVQTLPSDYFPDSAVASVAGLGGVGAGIGSMIFILTTGWVVDHFSYTPILTAAGVLAPIGTVALFMLTGGMTTSGAAKAGTQN
jgi:ACS family hexuronate transporter-like MFS transporter